jgi:hypothetical protein
MAESNPIARCELDAAGLSAQRDRYRRLGRNALAIERRRRQLLVSFGADVDRALVEETIAIERRCCPFFRIMFDPEARLLLISVDRADEDPALGALRLALAPD